MPTMRVKADQLGPLELPDEALDYVAGGRAFPFPQIGTVTAQFAFTSAVPDKLGEKIVYAHGAPEPLGGPFSAGQGVLNNTPGG